MKYMNFRRIVAWAGIVILALMYIALLVMALMGASIQNDMFGFCLIATIIVPVFCFAIIWIHGRYNDKRVMSDPENPVADKTEKE